MSSLVGTHKARAKEWDLGISSTGNEQIAILFEIVEGEHAGKSRTWFGSFSDAAIDRTLDSMRHCGWDGDSLATIDGLGANEVEIVVEAEEYQGKVNEKIRWVNKPAALKLKHQLTGAARDAFASKLRGKVLAHKQKYGAQPKPTAPAANGQRRTAPSEPGAHDDPGFEDGPY